MADKDTRLLSSHPAAYSRAFERFLASCDQEGAILKCMENHIEPILARNIKSGSLFRVLSVGSGEGENDLNILKALSKILLKQGQPRQPLLLTNRVIEPAVNRISVFRAKAENVAETLEGRAKADFEWMPMTFQEYAKQKKEYDVKMNLVHFIHSIYYVDIEEALVHCYEKELGVQGVIVVIFQMKEDVMFKFGKKFPSQRSTCYPKKDVIAVAREKGWKYFECPGDSNYLDITAIFDSSSKEGNDLLDFLTDMIDVRKNEQRATVEKILKFWKKQSFLSKERKRMVELRDKAAIILKVFDI